MTAIGNHSSSVSVSTQQQNIVQMRAVTNEQRVTRPEPIYNIEDIVQISRPVTNVQIQTNTLNVTEVSPRPEVINLQNYISIVQGTFSTSSSNTSNSVDVFA